MCVLDYSKLTLQTPADPTMPKTVAELREEMEKIGLTLPESIYTVFQKAVIAHLDEELEEAQGYYARLRVIPRANGKRYDLADDSEVFRFNLQLIEKYLEMMTRQRR